MSLEKISKESANGIWCKNIIDPTSNGFPIIQFASHNGLPDANTCNALLPNDYICCNGISQLIFEYAGMKNCRLFVSRDVSYFNINCFIWNNKGYMLHFIKKKGLLLEFNLQMCSIYTSNDNNEWFRCTNIIGDTFLPGISNERELCPDVKIGFRKYPNVRSNGCKICFYCVNDLKNPTGSLRKYQNIACFHCRYSGARPLPDPLVPNTAVAKFLGEQGWKEKIFHQKQ